MQLILESNAIVSVLLVQGETNRIYDGVEAETRKSQAHFQII